MVLACGSGAPAAEPDPAEQRKKDEAAAQKKTVDEQWNKLFSGRPFAFKETDNFLIYSTGAEKDLESIATTAEEQFVVIKKKLQVGPKDELWPGKLVMHVFAERGQFTTFIRQTEKRRVDDEETGSYVHQAALSYITAGPPTRGMGNTLQVEMVRQLASATISKKVKPPEWFVTGFGRSMAYRYDPKQAAADRKKGAELVRMGKTAKDVWTGTNLAYDEAQVLNGILVDYLANGPAARYFPEILDNMGAETFDEVLKRVKLLPDQVAQGWRVWAARATP
jgi:hypothetical protein